MIGEALEITIVVSMLVLVGYPSLLMIADSVQHRRKRWARASHDRHRRDGR